MRTEKDWIKSAYVQMNKKLINIGSLCGHGAASMDFDRPEFFFDLAINEEILGEALLKAIVSSRFITLEEEDLIWANSESDHKNWVKGTMKKYGFKTKGDMFKPMFSCSVSKENDGYLFYPYHQRALTAWEGNEYTKANKFTIPLTATAAEMGAALRRCLALCTSKFDPPKNV